MNSEFESKFAMVRKEFPHAPRVTYFNSASYGPFCTPVAKAITDNCQLRLEADKDDSHDAFAALDNLRLTFATMTGARQSEIGIGSSTSFGINIAAYGLPLNKGDEVILSDTEFPALIYTWREAAKSRGLKLKFLPSSNRCFDIEKFKENLTARTRVLAISYVQFFNGYKNDIEQISNICKKHNIYLIVDGIQGMGVEPINLRTLGVDIFTSGCQKWMLSPQGGGFFFIADKIRNELTLPFTSWLSADWKVSFTELLDYERPLFDSAQAFEMGYYAVLNILGMSAAAKLIQSLGIENIQEHNHGLIDQLVDYIKANDFYAITSSMEEKHRSSIFTFTCPDFKKLHRQLLNEKIMLVQREGSIRVSVHLFNNRSDIDKIITVLKKFSS